MSVRFKLVGLAVLASLATIIVCVLCTNSFNNPFTPGVRTLGVAFFIVAGTAAMADVAIIYYHTVQPPHPKFLLTWDHRLAIRVHAIAGSAETILGIIAWATGSRTLAILTGVLALFQIAAAYYQIPAVFGMKGVTVPLYCAGITIHLFCAINLIATGDVAWLKLTWIALQTYAFVRIVFFMLNRTRAFRGSAYTVAVILGGTVTLPFIIGPIAPFFLIGIVLLYLALYSLIMRPTPAEWSGLFVEHVRRSLVPRLEGAWLRLGIALPEGLSSREEAALVFRQIDANGSGTLDLGEMEPILAALGVSTRLEASFRHHHDHGADTAITFDTFYTTLWLPSRVREPAGMQRDASLTDGQQARVVFDFLDVDGRGYVDEFEIEILLLEWGMELHEAQRTIRKLSGPTRVRYSFDDFHGRLKPIWRFGYETMTTDGE